MTTDSTPRAVVASLHRFPVKSMAGESPTEMHLGEAGFVGDRAFALVDTSDGTVASAKHPARWGRLLQARATFVDDPGPDQPLPPVLIELPDGTQVRSDDPDVDRVLSTFTGRTVRLAATAPSDRAFHEAWPDIDGLAPEQFVADTRVDVAPDELIDGDVTLSRIALGSMAPDGTFFDVTTLHLLSTATLRALRAADPAADFDPLRYRPNVVVDHDGDDFVENTWSGRSIRLGATASAVGLIPTMRCVMTTLAQTGGIEADRSTLRAVARANRLDIPGLGRWACAGVYATVAGGGTVRVGDEVLVADG
ncbi:MAG: MOSC domain-containing protein [Acidimicrobiales bacterium]